MRKIWKKKFVFVPLITLVLLVAGITIAAATPEPKVTLCHATGSATNPWVEVTVNASSVIELPNGHHYHSGDIIPSFEYQVPGRPDFEHRYYFNIFGVEFWSSWYDGPCGYLPPFAVDCQMEVIPTWQTKQYPGKNLDTVYAWGVTGREILANRCVIPPEPHDYWMKAKVVKDCDGWRVWLRIMDGDSPATGWMGSNQYLGTWSDPYTIEQHDAITNIQLNLSPYGPLSASVEAFSEPGECLVVRSFKKHQAYLENNCEGIVRVVNLYEGLVGEKPHVVDTFYNQEFYFTDPMAYETIPGDSIDLPAGYGGPAVFGPMDEPAACHDFGLRVIETSDCEGYYRKVNLQDHGKYVKWLYVDKGSWTDPYTIEMLPGLTIPMPEAYGEDVVFEDLYEPTECQILKTYKAHQALLEDNCEGVRREIHLYEGPASDPYRDLILDWVYDETILFTDIYTTEVVPVVTVNVPDDYGPDHIFEAMTEPESCLVVLKHEWKMNDTSDCIADTIDPWVSEGGWYRTNSPRYLPWTDPFALERYPETGLYSITFYWPDGYVEGPLHFYFEEPTHCQVPHQTAAWDDSDCDEYWGGYILDGEKVETFRGPWLDPYNPESITETVLVPIPDDELGEREFEVTVVKDMDCLQCKVTIAYYQARVRPTSPDVPFNYMSLPFRDGPFCAVITPEGTVPAPFRITSVCSLCPEDYPGGYVFEGEATEADVEPVYKIECYGKKVRYEWFGGDWTKWGLIYDPMYTTQGRLVNKYPRCEGCNDWIMDNAPADLYPEGWGQ